MAIYGHSLPMLVLDGPHCSHSSPDSCSHLQRPGGHCFTTNSLSRNSPTENVSRTFTTPLKVLSFWEVAPALLMPLQQCSCAEQQKSIFFLFLFASKKSHTLLVFTLERRPEHLFHWRPWRRAKRWLDCVELVHKRKATFQRAAGFNFQGL